MIVELFLCGIFLILINISDLRSCRIRNIAVIPMLLCGLVLGLLRRDLLPHLLGMCLPLVLFPLFALRCLGAGDIKALCAIGAVVGLQLSLRTMLFSILAGGILAAGFLVCQRNFRERLRYLWAYLKNCFYTRKLLSYEFGGKDKSCFRFSFAITAGTLLAFADRWFGWM